MLKNKSRAFIIVLLLTGIFSAGYYFTAVFTSISTVMPVQIQSDDGLGVTKINTPVTGWPAGWQYSGTVTCFCADYGEPYVNNDYEKLMINIFFWAGIGLAAILTALLKYKNN